MSGRTSHSLMLFCRVLFLCIIVQTCISSFASAGKLHESTNPFGQTFLEFSGDITRGDLAKIKSKIFSMRNKPAGIILNSPGGNLIEGIKLGQFFKKQRVRTIVPSGGICISACALAFLGGTNPVSGNPARAISKNSVIGFHQFRFATKKKYYSSEEVKDLVNVTQLMMWQLMQYFDQVNGNKDLLLLSLSTNSEKVSLVTPNNAAEYGIQVIPQKSLSSIKNRELQLPEPKAREFRQGRCAPSTGAYLITDIPWHDKDGGLVVRSLSSKSSQAIGVIPPYGRGIILEECSGYWCKIQYKCMYGWVVKGYIKKEKDALQSVVNVSANDVLHLRSGPYLTYEEVHRIPHDAENIINHGCQSSPVDKSIWCRVSYDNKNGWVHKAFLK